jgi:hypothetical protein
MVIANSLSVNRVKPADDEITDCKQRKFKDKFLDSG